MWDVPSRSPRLSFSLDTAPRFGGSSLSSDGRFLATTSGEVDNRIHIWETTTGALLGSCVGHKQGVWSLTFSPDSKTLASASDDSTVRLWNTATQQELLNIHRLGATLQGLLFSPDGQFLAGAEGFSSKPVLRFFRAPNVREVRTAQLIPSP